MKRFGRWACVALAVGVLASLPATASAQVVYYPPAPVVSYYPPAPNVTYSYYPSVPAPTTVYSAPAAVYSTPPTVYSAPFYATPATTVYSAPSAVYYPPTIANSGVVTTRSYFGLGVFRPFGWNQTSYYTPTTTYYTPGRVSYYYP